MRQRLALGSVGFSLENQWILEIAKGLHFLHANEVIHGDFSCQNIMIDFHGHAKICDFAGSKLGKKRAWARYQIRNQHPRYEGCQPTIGTDIFAFGSVVYEIATAKPALEHIRDALVLEDFQNGNFQLEAIPRQEVQCIIERCWREGYVSVSDICDDLGSLRSGDLD